MRWQCVILVLLILPAAAAQCDPDWSCSGWSDCTSSGFNIRQCTDLNGCQDTQNKPIEIKRCTDDNLYPVEDDNQDAASGLQGGESTPSQQNLAQQELQNAGEQEQDTENQMQDNAPSYQMNATDEGDEASVSGDAPNLFVGFLIIIGFILLGFLVGTILRKKANA